MRSESAIRWLSGTAAAALIACTTTGCAPPATEPDASTRIPAIKTATIHRKTADLPGMVDDLESDDSAVRLYAIEGLRRMTGQEFGYVYYACEQDRKPAVARWRQWLAEGGPSTLPAANYVQTRKNGS